MSELRQNLASKEWVVISHKRSVKPNKVLRKIISRPVSKNAYEKDCPFCAGNEKKFGIQEHSKIEYQSGQRIVKSIWNKYSIFDHFDGCPLEPEPFENAGIYKQLKGCGNHEVVIETREHNRTIIDLSHEDIAAILRMYVNRYEAFKSNPNNLITLIFKNYGVLAGQTQPHSHSQIVGSRIVPYYIRTLLQEGERHFDIHGSCVMCDIVGYERDQKIRIVDENDDFIVFVPFAAGSEHETWIVPKKHEAGISGLTGNQLDNLSTLFETLLKKFFHAAGNPDFNYVFRVAPYPLSNVPYFHWHIQIHPRTKVIGGFERGTRIPVNTVVPEASAKLLREFKVRD